MTELLERDAPLARLRACVAAAAAGTGAIALVAGEAGIGKTTLVRELARESAGTALWWGACDALQTPSPLAPLHDIARSAHPRLRKLLDGDMPTARLFREIVEELERLGPALVVIEDAHWADQSTFDFLRFVGRRIDRTRATLVITFRDDEVSSSHALRTVIGDLPSSLTTRIELERLSKDAVALLARRALRAPAGLYDATGGNPFFLTELLRHASIGVPRSVQDLVLARYARLAPASRDIVQLAAIVPARIERWLVDDVAAPGPGDVEACLDCGLLLADDASLRFRHELARVAIEKSLSPPLAQSLHAQALAALAERGVEPEKAARLMHHATHARAADAVMRFGPIAARLARDRGAHREAAAHYRATLHLAPRMTVEARLGLLEDYATECRATHRLGEAIAARGEIASLLEASGNALAQGRNLSQLALDLVLALDNAGADASSRRAIELLEALPPSVELASAYQVEAQLRMLNRDCAQSVARGEKAIDLATRLGDREVLAAATATVGAAMLFIDYDQGVRTLDRALELALDAGLDYVAANTYSNLGSGSGELFRMRAAEGYLQSAIRFATTNQIDVYRAYALSWLALCQVYLGRWDDAETHATEALESASESSTARVMALCALARLRVRRGDAGADSTLEQAAELALPTATLQRIAPVRAARAEAACARGDLEAVAREAGAAIALARDHRHVWHVGELSYWLARAGAAPAPAGECAEPYALQLAGRWREAAEAWARLDCPYEQARALAEGDEEAKLEALAIFERLGARPAAEALRRTLRETGVRGVPRGPRPATQRNPRGLTVRELDVLELLCRGLRNSEIAERLFRSVRTVEHHVESILGKLEARSRAEVPTIAARERLLDPKMGSETPQNP